MKRWKTLAAILAATAALGVVAGCSSSDSAEATTPAAAPTAPNTALQTDSEGQTVTAPPEETPTETGGGTTETETGGGGGEEPVGDVAAGQATFEGTCQGCHADGGRTAGVGPALAGLPGLNEDRIRTILQNGRGAMPAGLVSGTDEDNVVAYVLSLQ